MSNESDDRAPRVAFRVSPQLMQRARAVIDAVRRDPGQTHNVDELIAVILALTDKGLDYYFLEPLRRVQVGTMSMATARLGVAAAGRGLPTIVRRVIATLDSDQLAELTKFLEELLEPTETAGERPLQSNETR